MDNQYTRDELETMGIGAVGDRVMIDRTCRIFGAKCIRIGSDVRIDAFCVLSAGRDGITIGNHVHLGVGVTIVGQGNVVIEDFCGLSARVAVFSSNEDYSGGAMTNPTIPDEFRNVTTAPVVLRKHALVGCGSVIMPGVTLGVGASVGALSFVNHSIPDFLVVFGTPLRKVGVRSKELLAMETRFLEKKQAGRFT